MSQQMVTFITGIAALWVIAHPSMNLLTSFLSHR